MRIKWATRYRLNSRHQIVLAVLGFMGVHSASAQCAGPIIDDSTVSRLFTVTPQSVVVWDWDGDGPGIGTIAVAHSRTIGLSNGGAWRYIWPFGVSSTDRLMTWDSDGAGPQPNRLVKYGGTFIGTWDGIAAGSILTTGLPGEIRSLVSWSKGGSSGGPSSLVASCAGGLTGAGGIFERVGSSWVRLGTLSTASTLLVHDPDGAGPAGEMLFAGGLWESPGPSGTIKQGVMAWNGSAWFVPGEGLNNAVASMVSWDRDGDGPVPSVLICGGAFTASGSNTSVKRLAKWDGVSWSVVGSGSPQQVTALGTVLRPTTGLHDLIAGGMFSNIGGTSANHIAAYDGTRWSALGGGLPDAPSFIACWNPNGPLADTFEIFTNLGKYDGASWATTNNTHGLWDTTVGGVWDADGAGPNLAKLVIPARGYDGRALVVTWDGLRWEQIPLGVDASIKSIATFDFDGGGPRGIDLVLGGYIPYASDGSSFGHIGVLNGAVFEPLGVGFRSVPTSSLPYVTSLATWDPDGSGPLPSTLFAGGAFTHSGTTELNRVASWDGSEWRPLGGGLTKEPAKMLRWDPDGAGAEPDSLLVAGDFAVSNTPGVGVLALWDGIGWSAFPGPTPARVSMMSIWDPDGPGPAQRSPMTDGFGSSDSYCDDSGWCETTYQQSIRRWSGSQWTAVAGTSSAFSCDESGCCGDLYGITAMQHWDPDGPGPRLPVVALGGQIPGRGTILAHGSDPLIYPFLWWLESWYDDGGHCAYDDTIVHDLTSFDPDGALGQVNPILCVHATFQWYQAASSAGGSQIPGGNLARFMDGAPGFLVQPRRIDSPVREDVVGIEARALGPGVVSYQWFRNGVALTKGATGSGSVIHSPDAPVLVISGFNTDDGGEYWCVASNSCGNRVSELFTFLPPGECDADYNADMTTDILDLLDFISDFSSCESTPAPCGDYGTADRNGDTLVDILDFLDFIAQFSGDC